MVPPAGAADLHLVDGEVGVQRREPLELVRAPGRTRGLPQRVTEDPRHEGESLLAADRARLLRGLAVKAGGAEQVGPRIADLLHGDTTGVDVREQRTALQRIVDHLSLGTHPRQGTRGGPCVRSDRPRVMRPGG